jgi:hypothetical protein
MTFKDPKSIFYNLHHIRVLPDWVKRGYAFYRPEKYILQHIRVLPDYAGMPFKNSKSIIYTTHIRVLPDWVKRGYDV